MQESTLEQELDLEIKQAIVESRVYQESFTTEFENIEKQTKNTEKASIDLLVKELGEKNRTIYELNELLLKCGKWASSLETNLKTQVVQLKSQAETLIKTAEEQILHYATSTSSLEADRNNQSVRLKEEMDVREGMSRTAKDFYKLSEQQQQFLSQKDQTILEYVKLLSSLESTLGKNIESFSEIHNMTEKLSALKIPEEAMHPLNYVRDVSAAALGTSISHVTNPNKRKREGEEENKQAEENDTSLDLALALSLQNRP